MLKAPSPKFGALGIGNYLGQLEIRLIRNFRLAFGL